MARRGRAPLRFPPTVRQVAAGRDAYVGANALRLLKRHAVRWWTFRERPTTLELSGARLVKSIEPFGEHSADDAAFLELLREYADYGVPRPTGYADVFHRLFRSPVVRWTHNRILAPAFVGGWQDALSVGSHRGVFYRYDIRSAYLWAGSLGLPDPQSYRFSRTIHDGSPGVYRVQLRQPIPDAPYPFNRAVDVLASTDEIDAYNLPIRRVLGGVRWTAEMDPAPMVDAIRAVSTWKAAGRMYWGRWASTTRVFCHTRSGARWGLKSLACNIPWAHLIVSRVKLRTWYASADAVHVYVDSVITPHALATGPRIGDWKLERTYEHGVMIRAPGWYGPLGGTLEKMAGIPESRRANYSGTVAPAA